jgi:aminoacyl tRNA synthase complex-interacting multifunctional protein 1
MATAIKLLDDMINELEVLVNLSPEVSSLNPKIEGEKKPANNKKAEKAPEIASTSAPATAATDAAAPSLNINSIDLRVGIIRKVTKHETADKLYCEEIDVG